MVDDGREVDFLDRTLFVDDGFVAVVVRDEPNVFELFLFDLDVDVVVVVVPFVEGIDLPPGRVVVPPPFVTVLLIVVLVVDAGRADDGREDDEVVEVRFERVGGRRDGPDDTVPLPAASSTSP